MKKIILGLSLMLASTTAFADCSMIDQIGGLDGPTKQAMKVECEQKKLDMVTTSVTEQVMDTSGNIITQITNPVVLSEWGQVAQEFAKALGIAAQELGIATNDFLGTPAGKLTAALIIWHVAGEGLIGIAIGIPLIMFTLWFGMRMVRKLNRAEITYSKERTWYGARIKEAEKFPEITENMAWIYFISCAFMFVGTWVILANMVY